MITSAVHTLYTKLISSVFIYAPRAWESPHTCCCYYPHKEEALWLYCQLVQTQVSAPSSNTDMEANKLCHRTWGKQNISAAEL